jgi:hypothetical protein
VLEGDDEREVERGDDRRTASATCVPRSRVFNSVATPSTAKLMTTTRKKSGPGIVSAASALRFVRAFVTSLRSLTDCE